MIVDRDFVKTYFNIVDDSLNARIDFMIPLVEADYLRIRNAAFDKDKHGKIIYPCDAKETAALMVMFKLNNTSKVSAADGSIDVQKEVSSVTWGSHSESYKGGDALNAEGVLKFGYPTSIVDRIIRYAGFRVV